MEIKYPKRKESRKLVAQIFYMDGDGTLPCLNILHDDKEKVTTIYSDGYVLCQSLKEFSDDDFVANIYEGDEITIKF